jgi:pimeloyl-ACP methyl ester carboxylesterase
MKRTIIYLAGTVVAVAAFVFPVAALAAQSGHRADAPTTKPSIVLVHGAWADSGSWNKVAKRLQREGYTVYAPPNPLMGLKYDSETVSDFLQSVPGPIVLVGHSYGGAVVTDAATGDSEVKALVYVDGYEPDEGQDIKELTGAESCLNAENLSTVFNFAHFPGNPEGVVDTYVKQSVFPGCFANGLPADEAAMLAATQRPLAVNALVEKSTAPAWRTIPSWAVIGTADHVIPPVSLRAMAKHADSKITEVVAPHLSMIAAPMVVAEVIRQAAKATS